MLFLNCSKIDFMKKILFLISIHLVFCNICLSQNDTIFLDKYLKNCPRNEAVNCRVITPHGDNYLFIDSKINGSIFMIAISSRKDRLMRNGKCTYYYDSGKKSSEGDYENDHPVGIWTSWKEFENDSSKNIYVNNTSVGLVENNVEEKSDSKIVFTVVEHQPEFEGGEIALKKYFAENLYYPMQAFRKNIQGTVFLTFVVNSDGSISDVKLLRGIDPECDAEAIRCVEKMPKWIPGMQSGKAVNVQFNLPVKFNLGL